MAMMTTLGIKMVKVRMRVWLKVRVLVRIGVRIRVRLGSS